MANEVMLWECIGTKLNEFTVRHLSSTLWALAKMDHIRGGVLLDAIAAEFVKKLNESNPQDMV